LPKPSIQALGNAHYLAPEADDAEDRLDDRALNNDEEAPVNSQPVRSARKEFVKSYYRHLAGFSSVIRPTLDSPFSVLSGPSANASQHHEEEEVRILTQPDLAVPVAAGSVHRAQ